MHIVQQVIAIVTGVIKEQLFLSFIWILRAIFD